MANVVLLRETKGRVVAFVALLASSSATTTSHGQSLQGWGRNNFGQTNHPATLTNVARMDCGFDHSVALRPDGTMAAWGWNFWGQCDVPAGMGTILSTAAGDWHSVAVNASGQVFCWGDNFNGQCDIPPEAVGVTAVAAGSQFTTALRANGTVVCWGRNVEGQCNVPPGLDRVVLVDSGADHSMALRSDTTVVCWGRGDSGKTAVPAGLSDVKDVSAGFMHSIALRHNGTVVAWGSNFYGQCTIPADLNSVVAVAAGGYHNVALQFNGAVRAWGAGLTNTSSGGNFGQSIVPATLSLTKVIDVAAGAYFSYAITNNVGPAPPGLALSTKSDTSCNAATGAIDLTVARASHFYWTGPSGFFSNSIDISGLAAGTYEGRAVGVGGSAIILVQIAVAPDEVAPVIGSYTANQSGMVNPNCMALVPDFRTSVVATDNCTASGQLVITQSPAAGTIVSIGAHPITIEVIDAAGNSDNVIATFTATGTQFTYYTDADADLYGTAPTTTTCLGSAPAGYAAQSGDCDDANAFVNPSRAEICNGIDDNCNGLVDDGLATNTYFVDADGDLFGLYGSTGIVACTHPPGTATNSLDCNDQHAGINPKALEVCDAANTDENCNGVADDADPTAWSLTKLPFYRDADADTYTVSTPTSFCDMPAGYESLPEGDCNDTVASIYPGAPELCANDGIDNDCDGEANADAEAVDSVSYFVDADSDGFGFGQGVKSCTPISGSIPNNADCDDTVVLYADADADGFGAGPMVPCNGVPTNTDCNDNSETVSPDAVELCSTVGLDNNCDANLTDVDANAPDKVDFFRDSDGDTYTTAETAKFCPGTTNEGWRPAVSSPLDCNDGSNAVFPGAAEACGNGIDDDCDGEADEGCGVFTLYLTPSPASSALGETFTVRASCTAPPAPLNGAQLALHFDATRLRLDVVNPVFTSPFDMEIAEEIDNAAGTLRYALGSPTQLDELTGAADLCDLTFTVLPGADQCGAANLVTFGNVGPFTTRFTRSADASPVVPALTNLPPVNLDSTPPVLSGVPAANITVAADAGSTFGALVSLPTVTAVDACEGDLSVTVTGAIASGLYPIGTTTVTWSASDSVGNTVTASRNIVVGNYQLLDARISLSTVQFGPTSHVLRVSVGGAVQLVTATTPASSGPTRPEVLVAGLQVPVAAGHACASVKSVSHTVTDASPVTIVGSRYAATFVLDPGDSNDDDMVEILDYGNFIVDRSTGANPTQAPEARSNYNGDHRVNNADFAVLSIHFFRVGSSCTPAIHARQPRDRISVKELRRTGQGELAAADLNRDGWVDMRDIQLFMQGGGGAVARPAVEGAGVQW